MGRRAYSNYAQVRLNVSIAPGRVEGRPAHLDWRLEAKNPGENWSLRHTVGFGSQRVAVAYPPCRDDMLALLVELLMSMHWTGEGVTLE